MAQSFYPVTSDIIEAALRACGAIDPEGGVTPSLAETTTAMQALNFLITSWQAHGMQVWCQKQATYILANGVNNPTVGPSGNINIARPTSIQQAWLRDVVVDPEVDIPLNIIGREEYNRISAKATTGVPNTLFYDPEYDVPGSNSGANAKGRIYLWPTPDTGVVAQYDLHFIYTRPIQDVADLADDLDFPQEWFNAVKWNLALALCFDYTVPIMKLREIKQMAKDSLELALAWDKDRASVTISPANG